MTAAAFAKWFEGLCRTVWMTATATNPVVDVLTTDLGCREVSLSPEEEAALPSVGSVVRELDWQSADLKPEDVVRAHESRSIVICVQTIVPLGMVDCGPGFTEYARE